MSNVEWASLMPRSRVAMREADIEEASADAEVL
jgi:hypothetical protein